MSSVNPCGVPLGLPQSPNKSRQSAAHPFQIEDGGHLGKTGKLVADSPGGDRGEIGYERPQLLVKLQTAKLRGPRELCYLSKQAQGLCQTHN